MFPLKAHVDGVVEVPVQRRAGEHGLGAVILVTHVEMVDANFGFSLSYVYHCLFRRCQLRTLAANIFIVSTKTSNTDAVPY